MFTALTISRTTRSDKDVLQYLYSQSFLEFNGKYFLEVLEYQR